MKLFSEKVEPTFTSSNLNVLGVRNFKEIFIDVFEFEINGKKFIAEKVSEYNGLPVVNIPLVLEGNEYTAPFVLRRGEIEVLFNSNNSTFIRPVLEEVQELIEQHTGNEQEKLLTLIKNSIDRLSTKLAEDIDSKTKEVEALVNEKIINLTTNTIPNIFLKNTNTDNISTLGVVNEKLELINKIVAEAENTKDTIINNLQRVSNETSQLTDRIDKGDNKSLSRLGNIKSQLENTITDAVNSFNHKITLVEDKVSNYHASKIKLIEKKITNLTEENKKHFISLIKESEQSLIQEIENIKQDIVSSIVIRGSDGKQQVNVNGIKSELEKIIGTKFTTEIAALKRLIELSSGGGSVAKQFAAGGIMDGTLNVTGQYLSAGIDLLTIFSNGDGGDTSVNTLVRSNSANWDAGYVGYNSLTALSGNWQNTYTTVSSNSANWNNAYNTGTVYQSNSASYATIDFTNSKFFPLTGGVITGETKINSNLTVFGNLTATGTTTFANTVFSVTSALSVVHIGSGPAMWVGNNGVGDIASFYDIDQGVEVLHVGGINSTNPNVGIKTSSPNKTFTVVGEISSTSDITTSGKIYIQGDGNSDQWNNVYTNTQGNSANWETSYRLVSANNIVYTTGDQTIAGNKTFSNNVTHNGLVKANAQSLYSSTASTDVITRELLDVSFGEKGICNLINSTAVGGTQTTTAYTLTNGNLSWGSAPLSGQAAVNATFSMANVSINGNSYSSNTGGQGSMVDWRANHALIFPISTPNSLTARDVEMRLYFGSINTSGINNAKIGTLQSVNGYGIKIYKHPINNTYVAQLVGRTSNGTGNITFATNATPIVITQNSHGLSGGDVVEILNVAGNTNANGVFTIQNVTTNTFELSGSTGSGTYVSGGAAQRVTSNSIELQPYSTYTLCLKWNYNSRTITLHLDDLDTPAVLSMDRIGTRYNVSMAQTAPIRIGFTSITDATPFLIFGYGVPLIFKI